MNQVLAAGAYYPPTSAFIGSPDSIFGIGLGATFASHEDAFATLVTEGFEARPERQAGRVQQFTLVRSVGGDKPTAALYCLYDRFGLLSTVSLAFAGEPCSDSKEALASALKIREFVRAVMGADSVHLDRLESWSTGTMRTYMPEAAFAAAWSSQPSNHIVVDDSEQFGLATRTLSGPVATVIVTSALDSVTALLTFRSSAAE